VVDNQFDLAQAPELVQAATVMPQQLMRAELPATVIERGVPAI
jgi:hypothetical protein